MHFVAWNGERWSEPFQPNELITDPAGGLMDRLGRSIAWNSDGYRGENWLSLDQWTEERAQAIASRSQLTGCSARLERP
jgi:hypothetical protein